MIKRGTYINYIKIIAMIFILFGGVVTSDICLNDIVVEAAVKNGFSTDSKGNKYYYKDGKKVKGLCTISGSVYLFDSTTGIMKTGFQTHNNYKYYFSVNSGKALKGLFSVGANKYYGNSKGILMGGIVTIDAGEKAGKYLFDIDSKKMKTGFQTYKGYNYYFSEDTGKALTGLINVGKDKYYANSKGILLKGIVTISSGSDAGIYLFDSTSRKMKTGFQIYKGYKYYFSIKTGKALKGLFTIGTNKYYGNSKGILLKGLITISSGNNAGVYLFDSDTREMLKGIQTHKDSSGKNYVYYFNEQTGKRETGFKEVNDKIYYFSPQYFTLQKGLRTIGADTYLFEKDTGEMLTGKQDYSDNSGTIYTYYFNKKTGKRESGFKELDGKKYYFSPQYFTLQKGLRTIGLDTYLFEKNTGEMLTGMQEYISSKGETYIYYFNPDTGKRESGIKNIDGKEYYFSPEYYTLQKGYSILIEGKNYYMDAETGAFSKGVFRVGNDETGYFYKYFDPSTETGFGETGLQEIDGDLYYIHPVYQYACLGLYYVNNCGDKDGLYYFAPDTEEYPGKAKKNCSLVIGNITFNVGNDYLVTFSTEVHDNMTNMFMSGLNRLGLPYGTPQGGLNGELNELRCNSFAAVCYKELSEESFDLLTWEDKRDARYPYEQSVICQENGKYSTDINEIETGDLMFWNNDNCGSLLETCDKHLNDPNGKHIHHVSIYMGQGSDNYHYTMEATEIDSAMCVRVARIKDMNIYSSEEEAGTHFYISAIGNLN